MKWKKLLLTALALAAGVIACVGATQPAQAVEINTLSTQLAAPVEQQTPPTAVFAWDGVRDSDVGILDQHNIKAVFLDINHVADLPRLHDFHIYLLAGDTNWGVEEMQKAVQKATTLGAAGIVLDVEGDYEALAGELEKIDSGDGCKVLVCIPYWLEGDVLERIVRVSDGCIIMNYNRTAERQQMDEEIKLCEKYDKSLYHAIELQEPGRYGLKDFNTYFGAGGIKAAEEKYRTEFRGTNVGFAIHSLEMLRREDPAR